MSEIGMSEIEKLHERITRLRERIVNLEAQQPHIKEALSRIEKSVEHMNGYLSKVVWIIIALFITALWKIVTSANLL